MDRTDEAIHLIISTTSGDIGRTMLVKLVFMSDYYARILLGAPISDLNYKLWDHGPFDPIFYKHLQHLKRAKLVKEEFEPGRVPSYSYEIPGPVEHIHLSEDEKKIIEAVCKRWGAWSTTRFLHEIVYRLDIIQKAIEKVKAGETIPEIDMPELDDLLKKKYGLDFKTYQESEKAFSEGKYSNIEDFIATL